MDASPHVVPARARAALGAELPVQITRRTQETADVVVLDLVDPQGRPLPAFSAGSHVDVYLSGGPTRQYAICGTTEDGLGYRIAVRRTPQSRGGSVALLAAPVGALLRIGTPRNRFPLAGGAVHHILLGAGIGVAPLVCMADRLATAGLSFELHYSDRTPERAAFREHLANAPFADRVHFHFADTPLAPSSALDPVIDTPPEGAHLYVCGPQGFIDWVLGAARAAGWPDDRLHWQFFGVDVPVAPHDADFEVLLASSGRVLAVPRGRRVVDVLREHGVVVPTSCGQGVCGTCMTRVLAGEPEHRDWLLTPAERAACDRFTPCVSRSRSGRLVLDL